MLSQCFLSLSLELVLRYQPGALARPMPGGQWKEDGRPACAHPHRGACQPARARHLGLFTDFCCPALRGLSLG